MATDEIQNYKDLVSSLEDRVYHSTRQVAELKEEIEILRQGRETWGNEFNAVIIMKDRCALLSQENESLRRQLTLGANAIRVCKYEISKMPEGQFWIATEDGEGMEVGAIKLAALIEKFWKEEF